MSASLESRPKHALWSRILWGSDWGVVCKYFFPIEYVRVFYLRLFLYWGLCIGLLYWSCFHACWLAVFGPVPFICFHFGVFFQVSKGKKKYIAERFSPKKLDHFIYYPSLNFLGGELTVFITPLHPLNFETWDVTFQSQRKVVTRHPQSRNVRGIWTARMLLLSWSVALWSLWIIAWKRTLATVDFGQVSWIAKGRWCYQ